jgi:hypothetical protein
VAVAFPTLGHFTPLRRIIARIEGPSMGNFIAGGLPLRHDAEPADLLVAGLT